ncbi:MAG: hypothetical protein JRL30_06280 [Deltaproteobacteria bacterium]|nr:hypothetical protein [Deltaproteobacteria bacterium]
MMASNSMREGTAARPEEMWVISSGRFSDMDVSRISDGGEPTSAVEYQISDFAKYMLNPHPIEVRKFLVGCEIHYRTPAWRQIRDRILNRLPHKMRRSPQGASRFREVLVSPSRKPLPPLTDEALKAHLSRIEGLLGPYHPVARKLTALDPGDVEDIVGICEDLSQEQTLLKLEGSVEEKIDYVVKHINQEVGVILGNAYIAEDLFEMRGFDFRSFRPERSYRLVRFVQDGVSKACVFGADNTVRFWVENVKLIRYLQLLEQSIQRNPNLRDSFLKCVDGRAKPFRLFFNRQIEIDYSHTNPPEIYKAVFKDCQLGREEKHAVISSLNSLRIGISFSYVPDADSGEQKLYTSLSVMHNVKALEPIKKDLPQLYSEISKRVAICEAGRFYLLDSAGGYRNAQ